MKYRKKPVVVEAHQMTRTQLMDNADWPEWLHVAWNGEYNAPGTLQNVFQGRHDGNMEIVTLEGVMKITPDDFVIQGVNGELYPCKPDIFKATYEEV